MIQFFFKTIAIYPNHQRALQRKQLDFSFKLIISICYLKQLTVTHKFLLEVFGLHVHPMPI